MPVIEPNQASFVKKPDHRFLIAALAVVVLAFFAGYAVGSRRSKDTVFQEGRRQLLEFLRVGEETGIIKIDRQRMDEVIGRAGWANETVGEAEPLSGRPLRMPDQ